MIAEGLVGRDVELTTLVGMVDNARAGRGRSVLVLGDAGIGKTRLAEALADTAVARGCTVAWGRCPDGEAPSYWAWRQAARAILGPRGDELFVTADAAGRVEFFASVTTALEEATAVRPATIVLEDLHWADAPTLALVQFVVGTLPGQHLLFVLTARDDPAEISQESATALANLPPAVVRLELSGLDEDATATVVKGVVGDDAPPGLLTTVHARTAGNPFFVTEIARLYALRGGDVIDVPKGVQQVLTRRLAHLSQRTAELLAVAAAAGAPDVDLIAAVSSRPKDEVIELLSAAAHARLLTTTASGFAFAHDLVRETVYEDQSASVRRRMHQAIAEALESFDEVDPADLAGHWMRAGDTQRAAPHALAAGRRAMAAMGYEQAVRYFRWALDGGAGDSIETLRSLGEAQVLSGQLVEGRDTLAEVATRASAGGRPSDVARAVLAMGAGAGGFEVDMADKRQLPALEWAIAELAVDETSLRAAVLARLSLLLAGRAEEDERRVALATEAADIARAAGDARAEVSALGATADALAGPDHVNARLETTARMAELARRVDDPALLLLARRMHLVALLEKGRLADVDAEIEAYERVAERLRLPLYAWPVSIWRGMRALMNGDVGAAVRHADEAETIGVRAGSDNARIMAFTLRLGVSMLVDPLPTFSADAEQAYDTWLGDLPEAYNWAPAAWFAHIGLTERARLLVHERLAAGIDDMSRDSEWLELVWMAGEAGRLIGEMEAVEQAYAALEPYADLWVVDGIAGACYGVTAYQLGRLAAALGRGDEAAKWLSMALEAHQAAGAQLLVDLTQKAIAELNNAKMSPISKKAGTTNPEQLSAQHWRQTTPGVSPIFENSRKNRHEQISDQDWRHTTPGVSPIFEDTGKTRSESSSQATSETFGRGEFVREGRVWRVMWRGETATVPDSKGMRDIAVLLATPSREVSVVDLVEGAGGPAAASAGTQADTGPQLDRKAREQYRQRLADLEEELAEADANADIGRSAALSEEKDFLVAELGAAVGLGGRARTTGDPVERARKAVTMRVGTALKAIAEVHPALARHLRASVSTGRFCTYRPEDPVTWAL